MGGVVKKRNMSPIGRWGWGEPTCVIVSWRQGFRCSTRNECMGWFAQVRLLVGSSPLAPGRLVSLWILVEVEGID